jgi:hypothetical protein
MIHEAGPLRPSDPEPIAGHDDPVIEHAAFGLRVWGQLKQIEPRETAFHAVAELEANELRAVVFYHLFAWHQAPGETAK